MACDKLKELGGPFDELSKFCGVEVQALGRDGGEIFSGEKRMELSEAKQVTKAVLTCAVSRGDAL